LQEHVTVLVFIYYLLFYFVLKKSTHFIHKHFLRIIS